MIVMKHNKKTQKYDKKTIEKFWGHVAISTNDRCWVWSGGKTSKSDGYGVFSTTNFKSTAHVYAYRVTFGRRLGGLMVLHDCDNPSCCNPYHLHLGTHALNMSERYDRSRTPKGLTRMNVQDIKNRISNGSATERQLAKEYGQDISVIRTVFRYRNWHRIRPSRIHGIV